MICTSCQKAEAVVFIKQIINNQVSQAALCAVCAAQAHVSLDPISPLNALLEILSHPKAPRPRTVVRCPGCGISWNDFRTTGRLGCGRCYEHFASHLKSLIPRMHSGAYAHRGKSPRRPGGTAPA